MSAMVNPELVQFRDFLNEKLAASPTWQTPEEALDEFLAMRETPEERLERLDDVRESLAEIKSGSLGTSASEYIAELRQRYRMDSR